MQERLSIEGTTLKIELGETEAKIISRARAFLFPLISAHVFMMSRLILAIATLGRDKTTEMFKRMEQGEDAVSVCEAAGIDIKTLLDKDIQWPSDKEIDEALGWSKQ